MLNEAAVLTTLKIYIFLQDHLQELANCHVL